MVHAFATLLARPGAVDALTRAEAGSPHDELFQSTDEPTGFQTVERWDSPEAVAAPLASEHVAQAMAAPDLLGAAPVIQSFERVGP